MADSNILDLTYLAFLLFMGDYLMNTLKFLKKPLLEKRRHIITEWDNSQESSDRFFKEIQYEGDKIPSITGLKLNTPPQPAACALSRYVTKIMLVISAQE